MKGRALSYFNIQRDRCRASVVLVRRIRKKHLKLLPKRKRLKDSVPTGKSKQQAAVERDRAEYYRLLTVGEEREECIRLGWTDEEVPRPAEATAEWNIERCAAEVTVRRGKVLARMGWVEGPRKWLHVEEAVFLVESGALTLRWGECVMTIEQCHRLLAETGYPLIKFFAYGHLKRLGFNIVPIDTYRHYEEERRHRDAVREEEVKGEEEEVKGEEEPPPPPQPQQQQQQQQQQQESQKGWEWNGKEFVPVVGCQQDGWVWNGTEWLPENQKDEDGWRWTGEEWEPLEQPDGWKWDKDRWVETSPRVDPVFESLRVFSNHSLADEPPNPAQAPVELEDGRVIPGFDVYPPGVFKTRCMGPPTFRVYVCSYLDPPPALAVLQRVISLNHPIPVKLAVVDVGIVLFYDIHDRALPIIAPATSES